jgi:hypothetical protein
VNLIDAIPNLRRFRFHDWVVNVKVNNNNGRQQFIVAENHYPYRDKQVKFKVFFTVEPGGDLLFYKIVINQHGVGLHATRRRLVNEIKELLLL